MGPVAISGNAQERLALRCRCLAGYGTFTAANHPSSIKCVFIGAFESSVRDPGLSLGEYSSSNRSIAKVGGDLDGADPQELLRLKNNLTASDTMPFRLLDRDGNKLSGSVFRKAFGLHTSPSSEDDLQRKQGEQRRQENQQLETPLKRKSTDEPQQQNRQKRSKTTPVESSESSLECHRCGLGFSSLALLTDHLRSCRAKCERCNNLGIASIELANHQGAIRKCTHCKEANADCSGPITPVDEQKDTPQFSVLCPRCGSEVHRKYMCGHSRECPGKCKSCVGQVIPCLG